MMSLLSGKKKKKKSRQTHDGEIEIQVNKDTDHPSVAWQRLQESHPVRMLPTDLFEREPRKENSLRFVCISDTHGVIEDSRQQFAQRIPDGDVLIHSGDFTMAGDPSEVTKFDSFVARLPHPVKLVIAGNHEMTFEKNNCSGHPTLIRQQLGLTMKASEEEVVKGCKDLLEHILYLEDESISICGIKVYGTPWVPTFGSWGFSLRRGENLLEVWDKIPSLSDILITHSPPCGYGDKASGGKQAGCVELLNTVVQRVKPKFHVFGHIHSGYGMFTNGATTFINSSICSDRYRPDNDPIVFDFPLPEGYSREDFAQLSTETLRQEKQNSADTPCGNQDKQLTERGANGAAVDNTLMHRELIAKFRKDNSGDDAEREISERIAQL